MKGVRNEFIDDLVEQSIYSLKKSGMSDEKANEIAYSLVDHLVESWGGMTIYFPKVDREKLMRRDVEIHEKFNGCNYHELAKEYGITPQAIRMVIHRAEKYLGSPSHSKKVDEYA
jgi:Mor family transcriptional regulator